MLGGSSSRAKDSTHRSLIARCCAALSEAIAQMLERHSLRRELAACASAGVLDQVIGELGVSRAELDQCVANHPRATRLGRQMAARLGIGERTLGHSRFARDIERNCATCPLHRRCREWLRSGACEGYQAFCPNAPFFEALRSQPSLRARTVM